MSLTRRPSIKGRDSVGREVSLLNSSTTEMSPSPVSQSQSQLPQLPFRQPSYDSYGSQRFAQRSYPPSSPHMVRTNSNASITSLTSVPSLLRSDSYDSYEARSPLTPTFTPNAHGRNHSFTEQYVKETPYYERNSMDEYRPYSTQKPYQSTNVQQYPEEQYYHEDSYQGVTERGPGKRYSCRYKELHNCNKTFTTSGHASRHAKIHTAEKMVCCTFTGCMKKFTRADNMKQHLDTHYKDKPRSASSSASSSGRLNGKSTLTMPARVQKKASPSINNLQSPRPRMPSRISTSEIPPFDLSRDQQQFQPQQDLFYAQMGSGPSPTQTDFQSLPTRSKSPNRLDILAQAASENMI
ncbi:uncharacterized protein EAF01_001580 [Botrytis porri]|uniref:C2H2-type domain-containing protein n=1 Tax=Botrytis porri TaxID=87229 RepID=A0A4Z1KNT6_9HELO|nr:uncharacterized protein EAF01_001580 [Botrytis porri]KAF7912559.1 hypothetical protein EAF01_001580 [Botrytis porri]TGO83039.1 hypothetical protein BPOR_0713g00010 [Botrytis porri]